MAANLVSTLLLAALLLLGPSSCGHAPLPEIEVETGAGAEVTPDGLQRAHNVGYQEVWLKPDADFRDYEAVLLEPISVAYKRQPRSSRSGGRDGNFALTDAQMETFKRYFHEAFSKELDALEYWNVVDAPGPEVLRIQAEVIDLIIKVPTQRTGGERTFTTSTGEMTLLLELRDSLSGEILARVAERREARAAGHGGINDLYYSNPVSNSDAVRRVFRRWAQILAARLDQVHALPPSEAVAP